MKKVLKIYYEYGVGIFINFFLKKHISMLLDFGMR
jgi:hypothetical protein